MTRPVVGIDPGKDGAIVRLGGQHANPNQTLVAEAWLLPYDDAGLSGRALSRLLEDVCYSGQEHVILERAQSFPGQGIASSFKYGRDYGVILGVLDALRIPYETVAPGVWHRRVVGVGAADPKARARAVVEARLPHLELRPGRRRVAHDGIVDAACLALYGQEVGRG